MHGLIFETSIWLLAGSTRYRSRLRRRRDGRPDAFLLGRGARARASSPYRYPSACNVNNISAATAARGLELRRRRRTPTDSARGPIARPPACNVNSISAATAARGLELGPRARRVVALSLPVGVQRQQHLCCDGGAGAGVEATSERARASGRRHRRLFARGERC